MNARFTRPSRRVRAAVGALIVSIVSASCGNSEVVQHGARFSSDGRFVIATGREPACGCLTISNIRRDVLRPLFLEARLFGIKTGEQIVEPGQPLRVQFDWAGPENENVYVLSIYDTRPEDRTEKDLTQGSQDPLDRGRLDGIQDYLQVTDGEIETTCNEVCEFGTLGMNRAYNARLGQNKVESHEPGVHLTKNGHIIEAVASTAQSTSNCGCMMLRNIAQRDVVLQSSLHGVEIGRMTVRRDSDVFVAFDDAGGRPDDVYAISAVSVDSMAAQSSGTAMKGASAATLRLTDYIHVVGQLDAMQCDANPPNPGARFKLPLTDFPNSLVSLNLDPQVFETLKAPAVVDQLSAIKCPFGAGADGSLGLSTRVLGAKTATPGQPPAAGAVK